MFEYVGPAELTIMRGGESPSAVARFSIPLDCRRAWLILGRSGGTDRVDGLLVPIGADDHASPHLRCINLSGRSVFIESGDMRHELASPAADLIPSAGTATLQISVKTRGHWRRVSQLDLQAADGAAAAVVLFPPFREGELQPQVRIIYDQLE